MLTERTLRDYAWCPKLLKEPKNLTGRFKPNQNDWITPHIVDALTERRSNKYVTIEEDFLDGHVLYNNEGSQGFWVVVQTEEGSLLLRIDQIMIDDQDMIIMYRNQKTEFASDDERNVEDACRTMLYFHFKNYLPEGTFTIISHQLDGGEISTDGIVSGDLRQAEDLLSKVFEVEQGLTEGSANTKNCPRCWWKECPYKVKPQPIVKPGRSGMAK